jgi:hypothetical protein
MIFYDILMIFRWKQLKLMEKNGEMTMARHVEFSKTYVPSVCVCSVLCSCLYIVYRCTIVSVFMLRSIDVAKDG